MIKRRRNHTLKKSKVQPFKSRYTLRRKKYLHFYYYTEQKVIPHKKKNEFVLYKKIQMGQKKKDMLGKKFCN